MRTLNDRHRRSTFQRDERGVSEVVGFILTFAISSLFLLAAMTAFSSARTNSDYVITAVELKALADDVAGKVVQAGLEGQDFPNATMNLTINLPQDLNGHPYYVQARAWGVYVNTTDGALSASATTFKLDAVSGTTVSGKVYSSGQSLVVTYSLQNSNRDISIHT